jgi:hypothetical protein
MKSAGSLQMALATKRDVEKIANAVVGKPDFFRGVDFSGNCITGMAWNRELLAEQKKRTGICVVKQGRKVVGFGMPITYSMEKKVTDASIIHFDAMLAGNSGDAVNYYSKRQETASISINVVGTGAGEKILRMLLNGVAILAESRPEVRRLSGFVPEGLKKAAMRIGLEPSSGNSKDVVFVTLEFEGKRIRQKPVKIYGGPQAVIYDGCGIFSLPSLAAQFSEGGRRTGGDDIYDGGRGIC